MPDTFSADRRDGERILIMIVSENRRGHSVPEHIPIKSISQKAFTQKNKKSFGKIIEKEITLWYTRSVRACERAIPHKDCATDASSNFLSDETKSGVNTGCIHEHFCEI